jgi:hypothetical protein
MYILAVLEDVGDEAAAAALGPALATPLTAVFLARGVAVFGDGPGRLPLDVVARGMEMERLGGAAAEVAATPGAPASSATAAVGAVLGSATRTRFPPAPGAPPVE